MKDQNNRSARAMLLAKQELWLFRRRQGFRAIKIKSSGIPFSGRNERISKLGRYMASKIFGPRKRRTREHVIADQSVNYLERFIIDEGHIAQRLYNDYGYDL